MPPPLAYSSSQNMRIANGLTWWRQTPTHRTHTARIFVCLNNPRYTRIVLLYSVERDGQKKRHTICACEPRLVLSTEYALMRSRILRSVSWKISTANVLSGFPRCELSRTCWCFMCVCVLMLPPLMSLLAGWLLWSIPIRSASYDGFSACVCVFFRDRLICVSIGRAFESPRQCAMKSKLINSNAQSGGLAPHIHAHKLYVFRITRIAREYELQQKYTYTIHALICFRVFVCAFLWFSMHVALKISEIENSARCVVACREVCPNWADVAAAASVSNLTSDAHTPKTCRNMLCIVGSHSRKCWRISDDNNDDGNGNGDRHRPKACVQQRQNMAASARTLDWCVHVSISIVQAYGRTTVRCCCGLYEAGR